jgi:hypothetical protein
MLAAEGGKDISNVVTCHADCQRRLSASQTRKKNLRVWRVTFLNIFIMV